jgi:hypothetical protein
MTVQQGILCVANQVFPNGKYCGSCGRLHPQWCSFRALLLPGHMRPALYQSSITI